MDTVEELENITGYRFNDSAVALQALTHSSYAETHHMMHNDNERLEFLGDAVLELSVSDFLFASFPDLREGEMTRSRSCLVREESLYAAAKRMGLDRVIRMNEGEEKIGGREKPSIVSDAYEAVIAAIYLDGGYHEADSFIKRTLLSQLKEEDLKPKKDPKSLLQEKVQSKSKTAKIVYDLLETSGPDHRKSFKMRVCVDGIAFGEGIGYSKLEASENAAAEALLKMYSVQESE